MTSLRDSLYASILNFRSSIALPTASTAPTVLPVSILAISSAAFELRSSSSKYSKASLPPFSSSAVKSVMALVVDS